MTFEKLQQIINKNKIPPNVTLMSDSGWECDPTHMDGIYYNKDKNIIVFTQSGVSCESNYYDAPEWKLIWSDRAEQNFNKSIMDELQKIILTPVFSFVNNVEKLFKEEMLHENEQYYGVKKSKEEVNEISLKHPLFWEIRIHDDKFIWNTPIGYIGLRTDDIREKSCELEIYILKNYRKKGYGKLALKTLLDAVISMKVLVFDVDELVEKPFTPEEIKATVREENKASIGLLESCGFVEDVVNCFSMSLSEEAPANIIRVRNYTLRITRRNVDESTKGGMKNG